MQHVSTLTHVIQKAIGDFNFLQALLENNDKALSNYNMALTNEDKKTLKIMLSDKKELSGRELLSLVNFLNTGSSTELLHSFPVWGGK